VNRLSIKEVIQMAIKCKKKLPPWLVIRGMQSTDTASHCFPHNGATQMKSDKTKCCPGCGATGTSYIAGWSLKQYNCFEDLFGSFS
jgi:hypothetical protein